MRAAVLYAAACYLFFFFFLSPSFHSFVHSSRVLPLVGYGYGYGYVGCGCDARFPSPGLEYQDWIGFLFSVLFCSVLVVAR